MPAQRMSLPHQTSSPIIDLDDPSLYINRELSWLQFNWRVLEEALDERHPLLERVKFLAIFATNLDEFFMIRVSGLRRQVTGGVLEVPPDGMTPSEQLAAIHNTLAVHLARQASCWQQDLVPKLQQAGIRLQHYRDTQPQQRAFLRWYFEREVLPVLTPLAFDPTHPFPHISNLSFNLAVVVSDPQRGKRFARVKVEDVLPRLVRIPDEDQAQQHMQRGLTEGLANTFVWMEEVIAAHLDMLFPGLTVLAAYPFRVTRDVDLEIKDDEASDLLTDMEEQVGMRQFGSVIRLEVDQTMPDTVRTVLTRNLDLAPSLVYTVDSPLGMADLMELTHIDRPDLKDAPFLPAVPPVLMKKTDGVFAVLRRQDVLLYHPYNSFMPVVDFVGAAARDPQVLAIKQALYRVGENSPIVEALMEARENHKQVAVLVELKARFDEEHNIAWSRALEQAGVHVIYGVLGLKTHAKMCLVVRREADGLRRYVHMGTGNYNPVTGRIYTDLSYFTCDPALGADVADLFNALTGYSRQETYRKLLVAPVTMRQQLLTRIARETERHRQHGDGYLAFKMNALVDKACIQALYTASQAGVKIDLQVRGICCLRPGIPGLSETITVTSIVGRFLEHARIYYFRNGGEEEVWLGSADLMPRNLDRRVEILFPIDDPRLRQAIIQDILHIHFQDNVQARRLRSDGSYERLSPPPNTEGISAQDWLLQHWKTRSESIASRAQTRPGQGEPIASGFLPVPETDMPTPFAPPMPSSNGDSV
jgi:polyphosphate kinase